MTIDYLAELYYNTSVILPTNESEFVMKYPERFRDLPEQLRDLHEKWKLASEAKLQRNLKELSKDPKGRGWFREPEWAKNPETPVQQDRVYLLGTMVDRSLPGLSLEFFEHQYADLKQELREQYPEFKVSEQAPICLYVNVHLTSTIMSEQAVLQGLTPRLKVVKTVPSKGFMSAIVNWFKSPTRREISSLEVKLPFDGDVVNLRITRKFEDRGYAFLVPNHPASEKQGKYVFPPRGNSARV